MTPVEWVGLLGVVFVTLATGALAVAASRGATGSEGTGPAMPGVIVRNWPEVERVDVFAHRKVDQQGEIFFSSGDMAVPFCHAHKHGIRGSYTDGSCLYPREGDTVVTYKDGHRELIEKEGQ